MYEPQPGQVKTVQEVATELQFRPVTIYDYIGEGVIPAVRIGREGSLRPALRILVLPLFIDDRRYRPDEVADTLRVNVKTVYDLKDLMGFKKIHPERKKGLRALGADINKYLEQNKAQWEWN